VVEGRGGEGDGEEACRVLLPPGAEQPTSFCNGKQIFVMLPALPALPATNMVVTIKA
jgi:hypothetical protein